MRKLSCIFSLLIVGNSFADTIHVPTDSPTIQIAISQASTGDIIILEPGAYYEAISFGGKRVTIQSIDPLDPAIVAATVIDALDLGAVVTFLGNEDQGSQLKGLTITGGQTGVQGNFATATIQNCVIKDNLIGIDRFKGAIGNSEIRNNSTGIQGNQNTGSLVVTHCKITNNSSAGIVLTNWFGEFNNSTITDNAYGLLIENTPQPSSVKISDCTISHNSSIGVYCNNCITQISRSIISGNKNTGLYNFRGSVDNSIVVGNKGYGIQGYTYANDANILNCTIASNEAAGIYNVQGQIKHCILWNNSTPVLGSSTPILSGSVNPLFLQTGGWNLQSNRWVEGDYHLAADSPYINAGDPFYPPTDPQLDADQNPRVVGPRIDIGAYEFKTNCTGDDFDLDGVADACDKDIDNDGVTNSFDSCDYTPIGTETDNTGRPRADLNLDCVVNLADFAIMQRSMGD